MRMELAGHPQEASARVARRLLERCRARGNGFARPRSFAGAQAKVRTDSYGRADECGARFAAESTILASVIGCGSGAGDLMIFVCNHVNRPDI